MTKLIPLEDLHAHPGNPRLAPREDVVEQIAAQLNGEMDEAHALIVRPNGAGYQIVSGHHRKLAAAKAGLAAVPCWVREMSDEDAYMALALNNAQGELFWYEEGQHCYEATEPKRLALFDSVPEYARAIGKPTQVQALKYRKYAWEVWVSTAPDGDTPPATYNALYEIHAAKRWLWRALVAAMLDKSWSADATRKAVKLLKDIGEPPPHWANHRAIATRVVAGTLKRYDVDALSKRGEEALDAVSHRYLGRVYHRILLDRLRSAYPELPSEVARICGDVMDRQQEKSAAIAKRARDIEQAALREQEARAEREQRLSESVSLDEWRELDEETRKRVLFQKGSGPSFNKQENAEIEWAQWSWNPITGCLHDCPYCYAREIALDLENRMGKEGPYPNGFAPTLRPIHLLAPHSQKPPKQAAKDVRFKNVFTCSMADMFGRWVPSEWIEVVLTQMRSAPQWNFLCLTKFPKRMAEFDIPPNTWMGTTVDLQARVPAAEAAFIKVKAEFKWLSIEPMLEPLKFNRLDLFDWIVVGGASKQPKYAKTPDWRPPARWIYDLANQWVVAKGSLEGFYAKTNLFGSTCRDGFVSVPKGLPIEVEKAELPEVFRYLGRAKTVDQKPE